MLAKGKDIQWWPFHGHIGADLSTQAFNFVEELVGP